MRVCCFPLLLLFLGAASGAGQVPEMRITMDGSDLRTLFTRDPFSDDYLPCTVDFRGSVWREASVRFKGRSNRHFPKKPYRLKFSKDSPFFGAQQANLHSLYVDRSCLREKLAWDLFRDMGVMAPGGEFVRVTLNGLPRGLFLLVDKVDASFLRLKGKPVSSLYEADDVTAIADLTEQPEELLKVSFLKEAGEKDDYHDLRDLLRILNTVPDAEAPAVLDSLFNMESVLGWLCGNILTMMGDSYTKNYFLYDDASRKRGRWTVIPWDYDVSFGITGDPAVPYPASLLNDGLSATFEPLSGPGNVLKNLIWQHPILRERLRQRVDSLLRNVYTEERLFPRIDSLASYIREAAEADTFRRGTPGDFPECIDAVKYFITARRAYLQRVFVSPAPGLYGIATVRNIPTGLPLEFTGVDGRLLATLWFQEAEGLDSLTLYAHADSFPPCLDPAGRRTSVKRWLQIIPAPPGATFRASLRWMYHDASTGDREVGPSVPDEGHLGCWAWTGSGSEPLVSRVNRYANTCTVDSITERYAGYERYLFLQVR